MNAKRLVSQGAGRFFFLAWVLAAQVSFVPEADAFQSVKESLLPGETIAAPELAALLEKKEKPVILDARSKRSYDKGRIRGALLPHTPEYYRRQELFRTGASESHPEETPDLERRMKAFPKTAPIVTYCADGCQSGAYLLVRLKQMGFENVRALETGFESWKKSGYPVEKMDGTDV